MTELYSNSSLSTGQDNNDSKNRNFHKVFRKKGIPNDEVLINRYSCALQKEVLLLQGFLYVSKNYFCYYSNIVGFIHQVVIPLSKVKNIIKKNAALLVPNAIQIDTKTGESYFMLSFINRDSVYNQLMNLWEDYKKNHRASLLIKKTLVENYELLHRRAEKKFSQPLPMNNNINKINNNDENRESGVKRNIRTNSTPNFTPSGSPRLVGSKNKNTINLKDKKYNSYKKYIRHRSSNQKYSIQDDFLEDDEKVQNDFIFPKYIPKISSMKEYKIIRIFLMSTIIMISLVTILSIVLQLKISSISKEIKSIQNDPLYNFDSLSNSNENKENLIELFNDNETLEKIKKISDALGLTIPQLLYTNWEEYELIN